ncbi:TRAP transporter substrate-binding protein [Catenovulum adriaticum]|uniref:TRAP transporter substrate-binding protein n=1 Tax=Catenovulum adriaticum TaxID=2984846 RepID=A0ABY7AS00_9ALTE|nr:TRAP transporter substrate-binding protein [Catenovulum sp. TS8]WAJ71134.1 TRAP transporter substrate-binding protein [Catenovulum sp. TS8]
MQTIIKMMTALSLALALTACSEDKVNQSELRESFKPVTWKMVTTWPKNFPGLGTVPEQFAKDVAVMSAGRLNIKIYGAGEMVPALQIFDAVKSGAAQMGHGAAYYWKGKIPAAQFFTALPFGMNAQEMNSWFYYGGGNELWRELYEPFGLIPLPGGNTGVQMAGWFRKEINSLDDLKGLKMRIPGLAGDVISKLGAIPVSLPGGEIFSSMQSGAIDATDWVGPYNDQAFGLYKVAPYYYATAWQEAGAAMEFIINEEAMNALPKDLQRIVKVAAEKTNANMLALYTAKNNQALQTLINDHQVQVKQFPQDVIKGLKQASQEVIADLVATDPQTAKIYQSYKSFLTRSAKYHELTELNYYQNRQGVEWP